MSKLRSQLPKIDNYPEYLNKMWDKHLEPKPDNAPTVISTFAGCGGSSLGYSMAGYKELLAVEWDNNAVETFRLNFPDIPIYHGDISKLSVDECISVTGIKPGELDILDGSPPCQGFSTAGKRNIDDSRNQLYREYIRLLKGLRPKIFVMENVAGLVRGKMKIIFAEILCELKSSGYKVSTKLLDSAYFGIPQSRKRIIFIGIDEKFNRKISHPSAEYLPVTVGSAFVRVPEYQIIWPDYNTAVGKCCKGMKPGQSADEYWKPNWGFQLLRLQYNKPSPTISKDGGATGFIHPAEARKVSGGELKRLGSFPDSFRFVGNRKNVQDRIGNSVPPLFMEAIARHIKINILPQAERNN